MIIPVAKSLRPVFQQMPIRLDILDEGIRDVVFDAAFTAKP